MSVCICDFYHGTTFPLPAIQEALFSDLFFFKVDVQEILGRDWNLILARGFKSYLYWCFNPFSESEGSETKYY